MRLDCYFLMTIFLSTFYFHFKLLAGAQVNAMDKQRQTPLHVSTVEDKASILEVLLQNGANPDLVDVNLNNGMILNSIVLIITSNKIVI